MSDDPEQQQKKQLRPERLLGIRDPKPPEKLTEQRVHHTPSGTETRQEYTKEAREYFAQMERQKAERERAPTVNNREKLKKDLMLKYSRRQEKDKGDDFERE